MFYTQRLLFYACILHCYFNSISILIDVSFSTELVMQSIIHHEWMISYLIKEPILISWEVIFHVSFSLPTLFFKGFHMQTSSSRSGTHVYHTLVLISTILCSYFQSSVDRMLQRGNASMMVGASSWKDQFVDAFTVQAGECQFFMDILWHTSTAYNQAAHLSVCAESKWNICFD